MEKATKEAKTNNQKPQTTEKEDKMDKGFVNKNVEKVQKLIRQGWHVSEHDKAINFDLLKSKPLEDLLKDDKAIAEMQKMQQVVVCTPPPELKGQRDSNGEEIKIQYISLWENWEWEKVLESVGPVYMVKRPADKDARYMPFTEMGEQDMQWICKKVDGTPKKDEGFVIPKIGGVNFKTGTVVHRNDHPLVIQRTELHHKWHDVKRVNQRPVRTANRKDGNPNADPVQFAIKNLKKAKDDGNKEQIKFWTEKLELAKNLVG